MVEGHPQSVQPGTEDEDDLVELAQPTRDPHVEGVARLVRSEQEKQDCAGNLWAAESMAARVRVRVFADTSTTDGLAPAATNMFRNAAFTLDIPCTGGGRATMAILLRDGITCALTIAPPHRWGLPPKTAREMSSRIIRSHGLANSQRSCDSGGLNSV